MKNKKIKLFFLTLALSLICVNSVIISACASAAQQTISIKEHNLMLDLPNEYIYINTDNIKENSELLEEFGYTSNAFKEYIKLNNIIVFATEPENKIQLTVKSWSSEFSSNAEDMRLLSDEAFNSVAKELVTSKDASYKKVTVNSMLMIEVRKNDKDSGGEFCTVQYITIRNGNFYAVNFAFDGVLNDLKVDEAWNIVCGLNIKDTGSGDVWDIPSVIELLLIWLIIITAAVTIIVVIVSLIKDIIKRRGLNSDTDYIARNTRFFNKKGK